MALVHNPSLDGYNSFVSIEDATAYFAGTYFGSSKKWSEYDIDEQASLLITATRRLNALSWGGSPYSGTQSLAFPRSFQDPDEYGYGPAVSGEDEATYIPSWLKEATCEMAFWIMTEEDRPFSDIEAAMLQHEKTGPLDQTLRATYISFPPAVASILSAQGSWVIDLDGITGKRLRTSRVSL